MAFGHLLGGTFGALRAVTLGHVRFADFCAVTLGRMLLGE